MFKLREPFRIGSLSVIIIVLCKLSVVLLEIRSYVMCFIDDFGLFLRCVNLFCL